MSTPPTPSSPQLVRAIGRWSMVALVINSIVGSGIFGLPSTVAGLLGRASPLAVLLAGAGRGTVGALSQTGAGGGGFFVCPRGGGGPRGGGAPPGFFLARPGGGSS